jgi:hypothetical protein
VLSAGSLSAVPTGAHTPVVVVITGTDLASNASCGDTSVTVGRWHWALLQCNATALVLQSGAGGGVALDVTVTVGGQAGVISAAVSYAAPVITNVIGTGFSTAGTIVPPLFPSPSIPGPRARPLLPAAALVCPGAAARGPQGLFAVAVPSPTRHCSVAVPPPAHPPRPTAVLAGGSAVTLEGTSFGPVNAVRVVTFGPASGDPVYTPVCSLVADAGGVQNLACMVGPGVGAGLLWAVAVEGQASAVFPVPTAYRPPVISSVTGPGSALASTAGGEQVVILGSGFGPVDANAITNVTYGKTGVEFVAQACFVMADPVASLSRLQCLTAPGTGAGLQWVVTIAGQSSDPWGFTSYAPPSVLSFDGEGARNADTQGAQRVRVWGTNFGAALGPNDTISYRVVVANASDNRLPVVDVAGPGGVLTFVPLNCTIVVPHTGIDCYTAPGGGGSMLWTVQIDGQLNRDPVASYGAPQIFSLARVGAAGQVAPVGPAGLPTAGNVTLLVSGANFGPASSAGPLGSGRGPLVQYVRVLSQVQEVPVASFTVLNHTALRVVVGPGIGKNLTLRVGVAGQGSTSAAGATLDYLPPVVTGVTPSRGPANAAGGVYAVVVSGVNLGLSAGASVSVIVGNPEDGSASGPVPATPLFPPGGVGQPLEQVSFLMPAGFGTRRAVRVLVYPPLHPELASASDPLADGAVAFFDYPAPAVAAVVTSVVQNGTAAAEDVLARVGPVDLATVRLVTVLGGNLGSSAALSATSIGFSLRMQPRALGQAGPVPGAWEALPQAQVVNWTDASVTAYSTLTSAYVQLWYTLAHYGTGEVYTLGTDVASYIDVSPAVVRLSGVTAPPTLGGTRLTLTTEYMNPASSYTAAVTVGGAPCPIVNPLTGAVVPGDQVAQLLLALYGPSQPQYDISCVVPAGEGAAVPVVLSRDNSTSAPVTLAYQPPTLCVPPMRSRVLACVACVCRCLLVACGALRACIAGGRTGAALPTRSVMMCARVCLPACVCVRACRSRVACLLAVRRATVTVTDPAAPTPVTTPAGGLALVPTAAGVVTLSGANFGQNPVVILDAGLGCVVFRNSTPTPADQAAPCAVSATPATATQLTFVFPPGTGIGYSLTVVVAGQAAGAVAVSYKPPTVVSATVLPRAAPARFSVLTQLLGWQQEQLQAQPAAGGSTLGGDVVVLQGRNFGSVGANPEVQLVRSDGAVFQCSPAAPQVRGGVPAPPSPLRTVPPLPTCACVSTCTRRVYVVPHLAPRCVPLRRRLCVYVRVCACMCVYRYVRVAHGAPPPSPHGHRSLLVRHPFCSAPTPSSSS